jgi:predicted O-linked N-acetylglucosamine transferase (SPINDLY family)
MRLPDTFWCYDARVESLDGGDGLEVNDLPGLGGEAITFGCLNNFCKVNDAVLGLWARVMAEVPRSRLVLLCPRGESRGRVVRAMEQNQIDAGRIEFVEFAPRAQYLRTYRRIDIGLDTFPYNGHTTSLDSFWMGVPVVTLVGKTAVGRAGWSQLCNLGLSEWAAGTERRFVQIAVERAGDLGGLNTLRHDLRNRMQSSPLMDAPRFARGIEAAYRRIALGDAPQREA